VNVLQLSDAWFSYAVEPAVKGANLRMESGEIVALLGPNGAGKTTLTRLIMGLLHPSRGEILVMGVPNMEQSPEQIARDVAYVFQYADQQLFARTVIEEVAFAPLQFGRSKIDARDIAFHALLELGLETEAETHPYDLAPAQRKMIALAAALAQEPRLLILDEPTQGLDSRTRDRVCSVLLGAAARDVAVLCVTHDLNVVAEIADRVAVMKQGTITGDFPARSVVTDPAWARETGLALPSAASLSAALQLPSKPVRKSEVIQALKNR
jgi:energy-coupling factor transport system ATP-binding protein